MHKKVFLFITILLFLSSGVCQAESSESISGEILSGFRILPVAPAENDARLTVYRGDYIKFSYPETLGSLPFSMPELAYRGELLPAPANSPFFKMKATGTYTFTLGPVRGTIRVIDLVRPNYNEVTAGQATEILQNIEPFILDVRTPTEHRQIHLPGSELIPIQQLQARLQELEPRKHEDIFIYCATGNRSTVAARILADRGFKRIYNLRYGIHDWARRGHPYVSMTR